MIPLDRSTLGIPSWQYWIYVMLLSALVRAVLTFFKSFRLAHESGGNVSDFFRYFLRIFVGLSHRGVSPKLTPEEKERVRGDYLTAYALGVLELAAEL